MLPTGLENVLNPYVFPLAIVIAKGVQFPLYLGSLYARLDKCVDNVVWSMRYDVVTHPLSCFL